MKRLLLILSTASSPILCMEMQLSPYTEAVILDNQERISLLESKLNKNQRNLDELSYLAESREKGLLKEVATNQATTNDIALRLQALEGFTVDEVSASEIAHEQNSHSLLENNQILMQKLAALEAKVAAQQLTNSNQLVLANQEIKSLNNQTSWLKWGLGTAVVFGTTAIGYLWYTNSKLSTDLAQTNTNLKNLINALSGKKPEEKPITTALPGDLVRTKDISHLVKPEDLKEVSNQVADIKSRVEKLQDRTTALEARPKVTVDDHRHLHIEYDGKNKKIHDAWVAK